MVPPLFCKRGGLHSPTQTPGGRYRVSHGYGGVRISTSAETILPYGDLGPIPRGRGTEVMDVAVVTNTNLFEA